MECKDSFDSLLSKNFQKTFWKHLEASAFQVGTSFFHLLQKLQAVGEGKFNMLSLDDRAKMLWEKGHFVETITYYNYCLILYSLNREFVELFYDKTTQRILWISIANEHDMKKYLNKIEIPVL